MPVKNKSGWKKYTRKENKFLRDNYKIMPVKDIAAVLGKTESSIKSRAKYMGISKRKLKTKIVYKSIDQRRNRGFIRRFIQWVW